MTPVWNAVNDRLPPRGARVIVCGPDQDRGNERYGEMEVDIGTFNHERQAWELDNLYLKVRFWSEVPA